MINTSRKWPEWCSFIVSHIYDYLKQIQANSLYLRLRHGPKTGYARILAHLAVAVWKGAWKWNAFYPVSCIHGKLYHHPILRCEPCEMTFHIRNLYIVSTASQALQIRFPPNLFVKVLRIQSACSSGGFGHWSFPDIFLDSKIGCEIKLFTQGPWCRKIKAFM